MRKASSTVISSMTISSLGTKTMKPEVGLGVVGTKTQATSFPVLA